MTISVQDMSKEQCKFWVLRLSWLSDVRPPHKIFRGKEGICGDKLSMLLHYLCIPCCGRQAVVVGWEVWWPCSYTWKEYTSQMPGNFSTILAEHISRFVHRQYDMIYSSKASLMIVKLTVIQRYSYWYQLKSCWLVHHYISVKFNW